MELVIALRELTRKRERSHLHFSPINACVMEKRALLLNASVDSKKLRKVTVLMIKVSQ